MISSSQVKRVVLVILGYFLPLNNHSHLLYC